MNNTDASKLLQIAADLARNPWYESEDGTYSYCIHCSHIREHSEDCPVVQFEDFLEGVKSGRIT